MVVNRRVKPAGSRLGGRHDITKGEERLKAAAVETAASPPAAGGGWADRTAALNAGPRSFVVFF